MRKTTVFRLAACAAAACSVFSASGPQTHETLLGLSAATAAENAASYEPSYPDVDEPIDVVPEKFVEFELVKTIDFTDPATSMDGWVGRAVTPLSRGERSLLIKMLDDDPYFFTAPLEGLPAGKLLVKLRCRHTNNTGGKVYYVSDGEDYAEERSLAFSLSSDDAFHDYALLIDSPKPIVRLRFDIGDDAGEGELERLDFYRVVAAPVKFGLANVENGTLTFELLNRSLEPSQIVDVKRYGFDVRKVYPTTAIDVVDKSDVDCYFPMKRPFEEAEVVVKPRSTGKEISRRFFTFNESACAPAPGKYQEGEAPTLRGGDVAIRFAPDASGAEIYRSGVLVGAISPLFYEEGDGAEIVSKKVDLLADLAKTPEELAGAAADTRLVPVFRSIADNGKEIEFAVCEIPVAEARKATTAAADASVAYDPFNAAKKKTAGINRDGALAATVGFLRFSLNDDGILAFEYDAPRTIHAPVLRVPGTMKQATFPGVEYLEEGEHSSSTADIETPERVRYAPSIYWVAQPYAAIATDRGSLTLLYDDTKAQPVFAVPDFIDGDATSSRMNVCAKSLTGKIRVADAEPLEDAILWATKTFGLPEPPTPPRSGKEEENYILRGLTDSILKTPNGWVHAILSPKPPYNFAPSYGFDYVSTIWEITGEMPDVPRLDFGGSHIPNYSSLFMMCQGRALQERLRGQREAAAKAIQEDGSFHYSGKYLKGNRTDVASGYSGNKLYELGEDWRLTGNKDALALLLKGLEFANKERTPRGAQVWELSLHTPDIMGSSRCCMANIWAYEATGEAKYLDAARRWAITGLPFVFLWEDRTLPEFENRDVATSEPIDRQPMMKYSTIAVFGATGWVAPNWMGRPVQWCGLDYAHALIMLAPYDDTLDWRKIAEGIVASAECQLCEKDGIAGLLPDSFQAETQERFPYYINPCVVHMLRRVLDGKTTNVSVVDVNGRRVVVPFPAKAAGNVLRVTARKGMTYQIMIDGEELRTIESQGVDEIAF